MAEEKKEELEKEVKKKTTTKKSTAKTTTKKSVDKEKTTPKKDTVEERIPDKLDEEHADIILDMPTVEIEDELENEISQDFVDWLNEVGDTPDEEWPEEKKKEWFTPRVYDENRPWIHIGVICGMKPVKYRDLKKELDQILWVLPPWEYKHKIHGVRFSTNYENIKKYAKSRKKEFQTCPIYFHAGPQAKLRAFEHLVKQIKNGVLLVMKDKEDGAVNRLIRMAEMHNIKVIVVEY